MRAVRDHDKDELRDLYVSWSERMAANPEMGLPELRDMFDEWQFAGREPSNVTFEEKEIGGVETLTAIADAGAGRPVIMHLHGGGFVAGSTASHRKFAGHLAKAVGGRVVLVDYARAPESQFPGPPNDALAVYRALLDVEGVEPARLTISGDSAGGNLALAATLRARDEGMSLPASLLLFAPFVDQLHTGDTLESNSATDAIVSKPVLQLMTGLYLGDEVKGDNPLVNALHADLAGLPRTYVVVSSTETLYADATRLVERARNAGVDATLVTVDGQQHVFILAAGRSTEADEHIAAAGSWILRAQS